MVIPWTSHVWCKKVTHLSHVGHIHHNPTIPGLSLTSSCAVKASLVDAVGILQRASGDQMRPVSSNGLKPWLKPTELVSQVGLCWFMLVYVVLCWFVLVYVGLCWFMLVYVGFKPTYSNINQQNCWVEPCPPPQKSGFFHPAKLRYFTIQKPADFTITGEHQLLPGWIHISYKSKNLPFAERFSYILVVQWDIKPSIHQRTDPNGKVSQVSGGAQDVDVMWMKPADNGNIINQENANVSSRWCPTISIIYIYIVHIYIYTYNTYMYNIRKLRSIGSIEIMKVKLQSLAQDPENVCTATPPTSTNTCRISRPKHRSFDQSGDSPFSLPQIPSFHRTF